MPRKFVSRDRQSHVIHIAGSVTEAVFSFLGPASDALNKAGFKQTIVMLELPSGHRGPMRFSPGIDVHAIPLDHKGHRHWFAMAKVVQSLNASQRFDAYHLHGFLPWAFGTRLGKLIQPQAQVYYSPHGSRTLSLLRPLQITVGSVMALMSPAARPPEMIASSLADAERMLPMANHPVLTIESAIDDAFFEMPRKEARRPLLVSGGTLHSHRSVELFCRLAVVMSAAELGLSFNWIGHAEPSDTQLLKAANVGHFPTVAPLQMASRLAAGWIFMAASAADEFPVLLASAMALGLPCVVANTPQHRELVNHGENGLIYQSEEEALAMVSRLIDDPALRVKLGLSARVDAQRRFSRSKLDSALLAAYLGEASADDDNAPAKAINRPQTSTL